MVGSKQWFRVRQHCPVCYGSGDMAQGRGRHSYGFLSENYAHWTLGKHITQLERYATVGLLAARRFRTTMYLVPRPATSLYSLGQRPPGGLLWVNRDGEVTKVGSPIIYMYSAFQSQE